MTEYDLLKGNVHIESFMTFAEKGEERSNLLSPSLLSPVLTHVPAFTIWTVWGKCQCVDQRYGFFECQSMTHSLVAAT
jgi:hypothetical protein